MGDERWPVSVKGVVITERRVLLLENDRDEWELPGGRLQRGETPEACVRREIAEETGLTVEVDRLLDTWVYPVLACREVLIVTFGCRPLDRVPPVTISDEHRRARFVPIEDCLDDRLDDRFDLALPDGYRASILAWSGGG